MADCAKDGSSSVLAIVGNRRSNTGASSASRAAISYKTLIQTATLLEKALFKHLGIDPNQVCSHISEVSPIIVGVAIPSSSPLFALCCQALHMTHDAGTCPLPLAIAPLDTADPLPRSKHLLECLRAQRPSIEVCSSPVTGMHARGLGLILTPGQRATSHWRRLLHDEADEETQSAASDSCHCGVFDVDEFIRGHSDLSVDEKWQWLWDDAAGGGAGAGAGAGAGGGAGGGGTSTEHDTTVDVGGGESGIAAESLADMSLWGGDEGDEDEEGDVVADRNNYAGEKDTDSGKFTGSIRLSPPPLPLVLSHVAFTSGTSCGAPKGCCSSLQALVSYCDSKNAAHGISSSSVVLLVSAATFDPALSDVIATFRAGGTLVVASRAELQDGVGALIRGFGVTHVLGTPSWFTHTDLMQEEEGPGTVPSLQVLSLGGERIPRRVVQKWARAAAAAAPGTGTASSSRVSAAGEVNTTADSRVRLCATYGVTEACVYQTLGEVFRGVELGGGGGGGTSVGLPLQGVHIRICPEVASSGNSASFSGSSDNDGEVEVVGEIVLEGCTVDAMSGYFNHTPASSSSSRSPFTVRTRGDGTASPCYRTGDLGRLCMRTGQLYLLGRIADAPRMLKFNGIRVDPLEIEACILEEYTDPSGWRDLGIAPHSPLVQDCAVTLTAEEVADGSDYREQAVQKIVAYCVVSDDFVSRELDMSPALLTPGLLCPPGPLLSLLRMRCSNSLKHGVVPSTFVLLRAVPLTATGKRNVAGLPPVSTCNNHFDRHDHDSDSSHGGGEGGGRVRGGGLLAHHSAAGAAIAAEIITCLNLPPCQHASITTQATFAMLGCDSLAVTRIVRALFAAHHGVFNSRRLGGVHGALDAEGPFAVKHIFGARNLGEYATWLKENHVCLGETLVGGGDGAAESSEGVDSKSDGASWSVVTTTRVHKQDEEGEESERGGDDDRVLRHESLLEAIALRQLRVALGLLALGVDASLSEHGGRLAKVSGRLARRTLFVSNAVHLSCRQGSHALVAVLLALGHSCKSPDANGSFPIHHVCLKLNESQESKTHLSSAMSDDVGSGNDGADRALCLELLLTLGKVPITIKDGNKQTILHCVARSGDPVLVKAAIALWRAAGEAGQVPTTYGAEHGGIWDWRDRWYRTPVQWAVLNGHVEALRLLLEAGCDPRPPPSRRPNRSTSAENETPLEICERVYLRASEEGLRERGRALVALLEAPPGRNPAAVIHS